MNVNNGLILTVGLDDVSQLIAKRVVEGGGYLLKECKDWRIAISFAQEAVPHLMIFDLNIQGGAGLKYLNERNKSRQLSKIPVLVLIERDDEKSASQARELGANDFIVKPIDARVLTQKIKKARRDDSSLSKKFGSHQAHEVNGRILSKIVMASEAGFVLESPVKIAPDTRVSVQSPLLNGLACQTCIFQKTNTPAQTGVAGLYLNEISVIGLSAVSVGRIRNILRSWS